MCSSMLDAWDGAARHIKQGAALAGVARSPIDRILDSATQRDWTGLSFYSDPSGDYTSDYVGERDADWPAYTVFQKDDPRRTRHRLVPHTQRLNARPARRGQRNSGWS